MGMDLAFLNLEIAYSIPWHLKSAYKLINTLRTFILKLNLNVNQIGRTELKPELLKKLIDAHPTNGILSALI